MNRQINTLLLALTVFAIVLFLYFTIGGLSLFFNGTGRIEQYDYTKFAFTCLCFSIAGTGMLDHANNNKNTLLITAFICILLGDLFLVLLPTLLNVTDKKYLLLTGTLFFAICHIVLSIRHLQDIHSDRVIPALLTALPVLAVTIVIITQMQKSLHQNSLFVPLLLYIGILDLSVWAGWGTIRRNQFPKTNARLIVAGITCFYACDLLVGIKSVFTGEVLLLLQNIVWILYSVALLSLSWSGHEFAKSRS